MPNQQRLSTLLTRREKKKESLSLAGQTDTVCRKTRFCPLISKEIESPFLSYHDYLQHSHSHSAKQQQRKQKMKLKNERNILPTPSFGEAKSKCLKTCAGTRYPLFGQNKRWKKKKRKNTEKSKTKLVRRTGYTGCRCSKLALHKHIRPVTADDGNARVTTHPNTTSQQAAGHAENGKHTQPSGPSRENRLNREMGERRERERDRSETHAHSREDEEEKGRKKRKKKNERKRGKEAHPPLVFCVYAPSEAPPTLPPFHPGPVKAKNLEPSRSSPQSF